MKVSCLNPFVRTLTGVTDDTGLFVRQVFPCGKCPVCRASDAKDWMFRLAVENNNSLNSKFITLTYNEKNIVRIGSVPVLHKQDLQLFIKRLRSWAARNFPDAPKLRFFAVGEYGGHTARPHYHVILFNVPSVSNLHKVIEKNWSKGFVTVSDISSKRIAYVANYSLFSFLFTNAKDSELPAPFRVMSRRPGIGFQYVTNKRFGYLQRTGKTFAEYKGFKYRFPRFYKDRFFITEEDRQRLHNEAAKQRQADSDVYESLYGDMDKARVEQGLPTVMQDFEKQYIDTLKKNFIIHKLHRKL